MSNLLWKKNYDNGLSTRDHFRNPFQHLVDDFFKGFSHIEPWENFNMTGFVPKLNVTENETEYKVMAELPGMEEKDFEIVVEGDLLKLKGEKKTNHEEKKENFHRFESSYGSFERAIRLPEIINMEATKAKFKNGLLTITVPKDKHASKSHKLHVEADEAAHDSDTH